MKQKTIYALGFFDGVHLGHQALLKACRHLAEQNSCKAGAVTFTTHPDSLVSGKTPALLTTNEDKKRLLYAYGMDTVVELPFDKQLMATPWADFLQQLLDNDHQIFAIILLILSDLRLYVHRVPVVNSSSPPEKPPAY